MKNAPIPKNDFERLEELRSYQILDTEAEKQFDDITFLASILTDSPASIISLIDKDRQWFKSKYGLDAGLTETPREISFCGHAIMGDELFEIPDTQADERFRDNPACESDPALRFYAGVPLITKHGFKLGTLCVIDYKEKKLSESQRQGLKKLARQVVILFEARLREIDLVQTNLKLDGIVSNIPLMLSSFDSSGKFEWINRAWKTELGWNLKDMKDNPDIMSEMYPVKSVRDDVLDFMTTSTTDWKDFLTRKKNSDFIHTRWTSIKLDSGKWIGIGQNIHENKLIENELISTNQRLAFVLQNAQVGLWEWWLDKEKVSCDRRWCEIVGLEFDNTPMERSTWENLLHPDDMRSIRKDLRLHLEGERDFYENAHRLRHANGKWVWILHKGKISERDDKGNPIKISGIALDITLQKENEQSLRDQQQKIHAIYDGSNDAIMTLDEDGFTDCNAKTLEMFKVSSKENFINYHPSDLSPKNQEDGTESFIKSNQYIQKAFEEGTAFFEWTHMRSTGEEFAAEVMLSTFEYKDKTVMQATVRDVTERKNLQKKYEEQLIISQHQAKLASIGQLAAGVGHEINNPLAIIKGYLSAVQEELRPSEKNLQHVYEMLGKIDIASNRISKIVQGLRTFSRSETIQLSIFSLKNAIEESFNLFKEIYSKQGVNLSLVMEAEGLIPIYGNKGRIEQVIVNLLSNAKDATEGKEGRAITLILREKNDFAHILVEDNGIGIPDSIAAKVFDPFFSTKDISKGSGIGLSIVSNIIKEHQGEITLETKQGVGTSFFITLPISQKSEEEETTSISGQKSIQTPVIRSIIAEDEEDLRKILKIQLTRLGVDCTLAKDGQEALDIYLKDPSFDLIITDLSMPNLSGLELATTIKDKAGLRKPKMIFMTGGVNRNHEKLEKTSLVFDDYVYKPFDIDDLIKKIRTLFPDKKWD